MDTFEAEWRVQDETEDEFAARYRKAKHLGAERAQYTPLAKAITFEPSTGQFALALTSGVTLTFGRGKLPQLDTASDETLASCLDVSPSGMAIECRPIDMDISVEGLVLDLVFGERWRVVVQTVLNRELAKSISPKKATAARENGKKGGRPRKLKEAG